MEGGTQAEGFRGKNAAEYILVHEGRSKGNWRKLDNEELHDM